MGIRNIWLRLVLSRQANVWAVPAVYIIVALILGWLMPELDSVFFTQASLFRIDTATSLLAAVATGMLTFTGFVFSMSFLIIQFGSSAYSPRLTSYFLQDAIVTHSLGMFMATFIYCLVGLVAVDLEGTGIASDFTMLTAAVGVMGSLIMFLVLIQHITHLQVTNVLYMVGDHAREVLDEMYPVEHGVTQNQDSAPEAKTKPSEEDLKQLQTLPVTQSILYFGGPLVVLWVEMNTLVSLASQAGGVIKVRYPVGDTIPNGAVILEVLGGEKTLPNWRLKRTIAMGRQRTIEQDLKYAIRLIVDVAIRALSPAVNDPTTAVQALDQLNDILGRLGNRVLDVGYIYDQNEQMRVVYPVPTWEDYLDLALHEIRIYGANSLQVMRRLRALLEDLLDTTPPERKELLQQHLDRVVASTERTFDDIHDRLDAQQADRQGIGLTRQID